MRESHRTDCFAIDASVTCLGRVFLQKREHKIRSCSRRSTTKNGTSPASCYVPWNSICNPSSRQFAIYAPSDCVTLEGATSSRQVWTSVSSKPTRCLKQLVIPPQNIIRTSSTHSSQYAITSKSVGGLLVPQCICSSFRYEFRFSFL